MSAKMKPVYIITRWRDWFTCSQSARVIQNPTWTPIPIAKDDRARRRLLLLPGGAEAYAALMLIVSVAAKMPERGVLIDDSGIVLDAFDVASLTGADAGLFERAIPLLMRPDIGYLDRRSRSASGELVAFDPDAKGLFANAADGPVSTAAGARSEHAPSTVDHARSQMNEDEDERSEAERIGDEMAPPLKFVAAPEAPESPVVREPPAPAVSSGKARDAISSSSSPRRKPGEPGEPGADKAAYGEKASAPPQAGSLPRDVALMKFNTFVHRLWAEKRTPQWKSDVTDTPQIFSEFIWAEFEGPPPDLERRLAIAIDLVPLAKRNGNRPMAWFKSELERRVGRVGEPPGFRGRKAGVG